MRDKHASSCNRRCFFPHVDINPKPARATVSLEDKARQKAHKLSLGCWQPLFRLIRSIAISRLTYGRVDIGTERSGADGLYLVEEDSEVCRIQFLSSRHLLPASRPEREICHILHTCRTCNILGADRLRIINQTQKKEVRPP